MRVRRPLGRVVVAAALATSAAVAVPPAASGHGSGGDHAASSSSSGGSGSGAPSARSAASGSGRLTSSHAGSASTPARERALRRQEIRTLGARHAAEHAAERAALRRWNALPAAARARAAASEQRAATRATAAAGSPDEVGRWTADRIALPTWAINAAVLPTGKVAYWGRAPLVDGRRLNAAPFYVLDPATGLSRQVDPPQERIDYDGNGTFDELAPAPIFCSGLSFLPSGELYVAGGNAFGPYDGPGHKNYGGFNGTYTFDPWTERWTSQPKMRKGRWYPTQAALPDGRTAIVSGYDESGDGTDNSDLELFTPAARRGGVGTLTRYPAGEKVTGDFYPQLQALPGGKVSFIGLERGDARTLDPTVLRDAAGTTSPWTQKPDTLARARYGGTAAVLPGTSRSIFLGGYGSGFSDAPETDAFAPATKVVETIDWASANPRWQTGASGGVPDLNVARSYANLVGLPDGGYALVGGAAGFDGKDGAGNNAARGDQALKGVELWHPGESAWRTGPPGAKWRGYHSTAVLLPDGRVLSAGDDYWGFGDTPEQGRGQNGVQDKGEVYEPAYLFDGDQLAPRPTITAGPSAVRPGASFGLGTTETGGRRITRVTLVAPDAVTHSNNMNRAFADLPVQRIDDTKVNVAAPSDPGVTPPGWYMLFAWDESGTPSVARWVQLRGDAPDAPVYPSPTTPPPTTTTAPTTPTTPEPPTTTTTPTTPTDPGGGAGGGGSTGGGAGAGSTGGGSTGGGAGSGSSSSGGGSTGGGSGSGGGASSTGGGSTPSTGAPRPGPAVKDTRGPKVVLAARIPTRSSKAIALRVGSDEPGRIELRIRLGGRTQVVVVRPRTDRLAKTVSVRLGTASRRTLRARRTLRFVVRWSATDAGDRPSRGRSTIRVRAGGR